MQFGIIVLSDKKIVLKWDSNKTKYKNRLEKALLWMRNENVIPDGWGKYIDKK